MSPVALMTSVSAFLAAKMRLLVPSTPGYVGVYQFVAVSILTPFGLSKTDAIAYILLFQAMNYLMVLLWGGIGLWQQRRGSAANDVDVLGADSGIMKAEEQA